MGSIHEKNQGPKISCYCTFNEEKRRRKIWLSIILWDLGLNVPKTAWASRGTSAGECGCCQKLGSRYTYSICIIVPQVVKLSPPFNTCFEIVSLYSRVGFLLAVEARCVRCYSMYIHWNKGMVNCYILTTIFQFSPQLRRGHNDQSRQGHQCSKTTLIIESQFHISIPLGIEPGSLMTTGNKRVDHWTSGTVYECSEIAGFPQRLHTIPHSLLLSSQQIFMNWDFSSSEYTTQVYSVS